MLIIKIGVVNAGGDQSDCQAAGGRKAQQIYSVGRWGGGEYADINQIGERKREKEVSKQ